MCLTLSLSVSELSFGIVVCIDFSSWVDFSRLGSGAEVIYTYTAVVVFNAFALPFLSWAFVSIFVYISKVLNDLARLGSGAEAIYLYTKSVMLKGK